MSNKRERLDRIITYLRDHGSASIKQLARTLAVSHMTVRRDMEILEAEGRVRLFHGGVSLSPTASLSSESVPLPAYLLRRAESENREEKRRISEHAISILNEHDTIFLDGGSTTELIAAELPDELEFTVVCWSMNILSIVTRKPNIKTIVLGGVYHESSGVFESSEGVEQLRGIRVTTAFMSANGIEPTLGVTCSNSFEVSVKQAAMRSSLHKILVADATKLGRVNSAHFADAQEFDTIITSGDVDQKTLDSFSDIGVSITVVPSEGVEIPKN